MCVCVVAEDGNDSHMLTNSCVCGAQKDGGYHEQRLQVVGEMVGMHVTFAGTPHLRPAVGTTT